MHRSSDTSVREVPQRMWGSLLTTPHGHTVWKTVGPFLEHLRSGQVQAMQPKTEEAENQVRAMLDLLGVRRARIHFLTASPATAGELMGSAMLRSVMRDTPSNGVASRFRRVLVCWADTVRLDMSFLDIAEREVRGERGKWEDYVWTATTDALGDAALPFFEVNNRRDMIIDCIATALAFAAVAAAAGMETEARLLATPATLAAQGHFMIGMLQNKAPVVLVASRPQTR